MASGRMGHLRWWSMDLTRRWSLLCLWYDIDKRGWWHRWHLQGPRRSFLSRDN